MRHTSIADTAEAWATSETSFLFDLASGVVTEILELYSGPMLREMRTDAERLRFRICTMRPILGISRSVVQWEHDNRAPSMVFSLLNQLRPDLTPTWEAALVDARLRRSG